MRMEETAQTISAIRASDMIMANMAARGLPGSKMKTIVNALEKRFPGKTALDEAAG
jgi:UDP-N-acetylmuramoyl-tripeptide--D-alanyl-D-alanine ligase